MNEYFSDNHKHLLWSALLEHGRYFSTDKETYGYITDTYGVEPIRFTYEHFRSNTGAEPGTYVGGYRVIDLKKYNLFLLKFGHLL